MPAIAGPGGPTIASRAGGPHHRPAGPEAPHRNLGLRIRYAGTSSPGARRPGNTNRPQPVCGDTLQVGINPGARSALTADRRETCLLSGPERLSMSRRWRDDLADRSGHGAG